MKLLFILFASLLFIGGREVKTTLTAEEQAQIITAHNKWRAKVKVPDIQWSDELAAEAQKWADYLAKKGCKMKHSNSSNGENIFWSNYESTPDEVVDDWASEIKYYRGGKIKSSKVHIYGHYTQVVWYNTKYVGCGRAKCKNGEEIWVCTYSPRGNYIGEKPY
jgi:pathogenesis-related protein 1